MPWSLITGGFYNGKEINSIYVNTVEGCLFFTCGLSADFYELLTTETLKFIPSPKKNSRSRSPGMEIIREFEEQFLLYVIVGRELHA